MRARYICGDTSISKHFSNIRKKILSLKRTRTELQTDVLEMRKKIRSHKSEKHRDVFDIKQGPGGIVDIEFLVQYLVLLHAHHVESVSTWSDNVRIMEALEKEKLLSQEDAHVLKKAYLAYRKYVHRQSLEEKQAISGQNSFKIMSDEVTRIWNHHLK